MSGRALKYVLCTQAQKKYKDAQDCYVEVLSYAPDNKIAKSRKEFLDNKLARRGG